jgi:hypothetical protein
MDMTSLMKLKGYLAETGMASVPDVASVERLLAECWDSFSGSNEAGMEGSKLLGRMEDVRWQTPILSFIIERHGGTVCGSTRAELHHWEVDLDEGSARIVKVGHRQLLPMAPRLSIRALADEIAEAVLGGCSHQHVRRQDDGSVCVLLSKVFPADSGFQRTVTTRRKRLIQYVAEKLSEQGWLRIGADDFRPPATATAPENS